MIKSEIYCLTDPITKNVMYVGKTVNGLSKRLYQHVHSGNCNKGKKDWIKELKLKGFYPIIEQIDAVPDKEIDFWEKHYIWLYRSWGFKLLNLTNGGEGSCGYSISEERKEHLRKINTGKKLSQESKNKISIALKERNKTHIHWAKTRKPVLSKEGLERVRLTAKERAVKLIGVPLAEETKRKISEAKKGKQSWNKGIKCREETKRKLSEKLKGRPANLGTFKKGEDNPNFGKKRSPETIQRMKEGWIKRKELKINNLK